jgi:hypothetical protein
VHRTCGCAVRSSHDRTCDEKKLKFFFGPFSSRFDPFPRVCFPGPKLSFFLQKKKYPYSKSRVIDNLVKTRNVFTRYIEDQQTYDALPKGLSYFWRPSRCRTHLGLAGITKQVQVCKPYLEHCDHFSEVESGGYEFGELVSTVHNTYVNPDSVAQFDFHQSDKSNVSLPLLSFLSSNDS